VEPKHNVQNTGAKQTTTVLGREVFGNEEGSPTVKVSFLNKSVPGVRTEDLEHVRARIDVWDKSGAAVASVSTGWWLDHYPEDAVHLLVNVTRCLHLAVFDNGKWVMPFITRRPSDDPNAGRKKWAIDGYPLSPGEFTAEITIVGGDNIGLKPVIVNFALTAEGKAEIL
jgi:hypothetical protein